MYIFHLICNFHIQSNTVRKETDTFVLKTNKFAEKFKLNEILWNSVLTTLKYIYIYSFYTFVVEIIIRPGVAGAVLETPL